MCIHLYNNVIKKKKQLINKNCTQMIYTADLNKFESTSVKKNKVPFVILS